MHRNDRASLTYYNGASNCFTRELLGFDKHRTFSERRVEELMPILLPSWFFADIFKDHDLGAVLLELVSNPQ